MKKHRLPLGTKVSFQGDCNVYEIAEYQTALACEEECHEEHECFPEPHIWVSKTSMTAMPLSALKTIFGEDGHGRDPTQEERELDEAGS